ncbi:lysozyme inhibitor LprI family protein [Mycobacterium montefiorense]|uniref:Lipoprotein LprI n=1 Tax=Mycobacterium montefiorense TaxID=154654 RepID=A0AA37UUH7_9MYCO|nr:lysozyme inhibitor LprI family protein [Mycobacterium montefiorense]GBG38518.1 lipoprotein LprI [Mycobacterium montefiorense]GKU34346.1 lipoprotein LprI [Mycobacterium montefiorense]GKU38967.1 lipoprotein LprI [Mycobacterium montefiorense]GKU47995.1 lipoprotein LprI [Mycobacterium montefiorense]GKU49732.1 lipoprotein LprI [Mycobacterium montefiorense]
MRPIAVIAAALLVGACSSTTNHPVSSSPGPTSSSPAPIAGALDCTKPANAAQQLVCSDPHLTDLDHRLQTAYQQAQARPGAHQSALTTAQTSWATSRDNCARNADVHTCVLEAYQTRLVQLAIADPATVAPPVVTYHCPADAGPLTAQFYNQLDPQTAVLNWKGAQQILFLLPSGSGARYGRQGSEYWEHQGAVTLDFNGTKFVCSTS